MNLTISVDSRQVQRRLTRLQQTIEQRGQATVGQVARYARDRIFQTMPHDTNDSRRSIISMTRRGSKTTPTAIVTQAYIPHPERPLWNGEMFNLPLWMFTSPEAISGWKAYGYGSRVMFKNGNIVAMRNVPYETFKKFRKDIDFEFGSAVK